LWTDLEICLKLSTGSNALLDEGTGSKSVFKINRRKKMVFVMLVDMIMPSSPLAYFKDP